MTARAVESLSRGFGPRRVIAERGSRNIAEAKPLTRAVDGGGKAQRSESLL
jgi:hypothetical protein